MSIRDYLRARGRLRAIHNRIKKLQSMRWSLSQRDLEPANNLVNICKESVDLTEEMAKLSEQIPLNPGIWRQVADLDKEAHKIAIAMRDRLRRDLRAQDKDRRRRSARR